MVCGCGVYVDENSFVRYWVYNGFVKVDFEKMFKLFGNFFIICEVLDKYYLFVLCFMFFGVYYRVFINYI